MKKFLLSALLVLLLFPVMVNAKNSKVKVYVYEAGGCPFCERQIEYLKGLDSYNKKFEIVSKELYVDHINWAQGKDFATGVKVANTFKAAGFEGASYDGTPFVVISDIYAATGYSTDLEKTINEAYEKGDKDIVKCIEDGKEECIKGVTAEDIAKAEDSRATDNTTDTDNNNTKTYSASTSNGNLIGTVIICTIITIAIYIIKSNKDKSEIINFISNK